MEFLDKSCGCEQPSTYHFVCDEGHLYEVKFGCHSRFRSQCPVCSKKWQKANEKRFVTAIRGMGSPRFLTLTLTKRKGINENLDRIHECRRALFRKIREKGIKIRSWIGIVEDGNHLHIIMDSDFVSFWYIQKIWKTITGDSYFVNIKRPTNLRSQPWVAAAYISKYMSKALGTDASPDLLKGFHVVQSWGIASLPKRAMSCPCCGKPVLFISGLQADELDQAAEYKRKVKPLQDPPGSCTISPDFG